MFKLRQRTTAGRLDNNNNNKQTNSLLDDKQTDSLIDDKQTESLLDDKQTDSSLDDKQTDSLLDDKQTASLLDDDVLGRHDYLLPELLDGTALKSALVPQKNKNRIIERYSGQFI